MTADAQTPTMSQFASKDHMIEYLQRELAAAKAEAEALREKLHNISNEFPAVYQRGLSDGIKQGLLRAAEILVKRMGMNEDDAEVEAIRAEAEKEGK